MGIENVTLASQSPTLVRAHANKVPSTMVSMAKPSDLSPVRHCCWSVTVQDEVVVQPTDLRSSARRAIEMVLSLTYGDRTYLQTEYSSWPLPRRRGDVGFGAVDPPKLCSPSCRTTA